MLQTIQDVNADFELAEIAVMRAILAIGGGQMVVVADDEDRENEGDLIMAAEFANSSAVNFMISEGKGLVCVAISEKRALELDLAPMVQHSTESMGTAFTVSVDATPFLGVKTGISATERAITIATLVNGEAKDLVKPGHMFPLVAKDGGVLERPGHTEAAVDLAVLAGCSPAGVIVEIIGRDGEMLRGADLRDFAAANGMPFLTIKQLRAFLSASENAND